MSVETAKKTVTRTWTQRIKAWFFNVPESKSEARRGTTDIGPVNLDTVRRKLKGDAKDSVCILTAAVDVGEYIAELFAAAIPTGRRDLGGYTPAIPSAQQLLRGTVLKLTRNVDLTSDEDEAMWQAYCDLFRVDASSLYHELTLESLIWADGLKGVSKLARVMPGIDAEPDAITLLSFAAAVMTYIDPLFLCAEVEGM